MTTMSAASAAIRLVRRADIGELSTITARVAVSPAAASKYIADRVANPQENHDRQQRRQQDAQPAQHGPPKRPQPLRAPSIPLLVLSRSRHWLSQFPPVTKSLTP